MSRVTMLACLIGSVLGACGGGDGSPDARVFTRGDAYEELGFANCVRLIVCGNFTGPIDDCIALTVRTSCGADAPPPHNATCGDPVSASAEGAVHSCSAALGIESCEDIVAGTHLDACVGTLY
jgi:hypothetical protein